MTQGFRLAEPTYEGLRAVKVEQLACARLGVLLVREAGDDTGTLVYKAQWGLVVDPLQGGVGVTGGLLFNGGDLVAPGLGFGFDHTHGRFFHEQYIVRRANVGLIFAHGNPGAGIEIDGLAVLHDPAGQTKLTVDLVAGALFGGLVYHFEVMLRLFN